MKFWYNMNKSAKSTNGKGGYNMNLRPHFIIPATDLDCRRTKGETKEECTIDMIQKSIDNGWYVTVAQISKEYHYFGGVRYQSGNKLLFLDNTVIQVD